MDTGQTSQERRAAIEELLRQLPSLSPAKDVAREVGELLDLLDEREAEIAKLNRALAELEDDHYYELSVVTHTHEREVAELQDQVHETQDAARRLPDELRRIAHGDGMHLLPETLITLGVPLAQAYAAERAFGSASTPANQLTLGGQHGVPAVV